MVYHSPFPSLDISQTNILDYIFPEDESPEVEPLWIDSRNPNINLSPAQALPWIKKLAAGLERLGVQRGEVVMIYTPNHIFVPVAYLGIVGGGYIFSGSNPAYTVPELVHQMEDTTAKAVLVHPSLLAKTLEAASQAGIPRARIFLFSDEEVDTADGITDWRRGLAVSDEDGHRYRWPRLSPEAATTTVATINYSSGTTGLPKGVCVSHANLIANVEQTICMRYAHKPFAFAQRPPERWIGFLPLYHAYGQLYTMLMAVRLRTPIYIMAEFRYEEFLYNIGRYQITSLQIAPPILVMLSKRPETQRYDLRSVRDVLCGAAPLSRELQNECQDRFQMQINQGWGMTEVTCGALHVPGGIRDNTGSVGQLDPNCECRLLDDDGNDVALGEPGEVYIRGPNICLGYWRNDAATRESLSPDGWLKTGDIAICNKEGFFWIVDRKKELIKVNALQVAPAELEGILLENEHIADAAVVGITLHNEEFPRAYVVLHAASASKTSPEQIQEWMAARVAKHKRLTGGVVLVDEVPKLASGKIQRKTMREWSKRDAAEILRKESASKSRARL